MGKSVGNVPFEDRSISGTIDANLETVSLNIQGCGTAVIDLSGTWTGTLEVYLSGPTTTTKELYVRRYIDDTFLNQIASVAGDGNGLYTVDVGGFRTITVKSVAWTSGSVTVEIDAGAGQHAVKLVGALNTGNNTIGQVITTNASEIKISDGVDIANVRALTNANAIDVAINDTAGNQVPLTAGRPHHVTASFTRPANTTAYTAGDVCSDSTSAPTIITFAGAARSNGSRGRIVSANLIDSANQATVGAFVLFVFDTAPAAQNDNSPIALSDAEAQAIVAIISFPSGDSTPSNINAGASGNRTYTGRDYVNGTVVGVMNRPFVCGGGSDDLYGMLLVNNAYTPVSGEEFTLRLGIEQD